MKRSKFSEAQIAFVLKRAEEGATIGEVCRKAGISDAPFYAWRKKYAGLMPSEMRRLRQLEDENAKLKRLVADLSLDKAMWAMDFVHDQLATGSKLRILKVIDTFSRFSPAVVPRFNFRAPDVIEVLDRVCGEVGYPASIRVDQGSEFISRDLDLWAYMKGVTLDFSRPGKPTDNAFIESFNGKFRTECLNQHWFMSLDDAVGKCETWRRDYNEVRPHSAIGNKPPISLVNRSAAYGPPLSARTG